MKNRKAQTKRLKKANKLLLEAIEQLYLEASSFLNEGKFDRKVVWHTGYIEHAINFAKGKPTPKETNENFNYDFDDIDE